MSGKKQTAWTILSLAIILFVSCDKQEDFIAEPVVAEPLPEYASRIEMPVLQRDSMSLFIVHQTSVQGQQVINYSLEYDCINRHSRWVAFTFYDVTAKNSVNRTDAWGDDPDVPEEYRSDREDYRGYDRGHICASNDRKFTVDANMQTFYYSNMSPQYGKFNQGIWQRLEALVQDWGRNPAFRDTLYVVKGGTITTDKVINYTGPHSIPVPAYYFMALVKYKAGYYDSIAFWLEHRDDYRSPYDLSLYAITVDELEEYTGFDFFHNLPDQLETPLESRLVKENWPGLLD